jgi:hypothetical protein
MIRVGSGGVIHFAPPREAIECFPLNFFIGHELAPVEVVETMCLQKMPIYLWARRVLSGRFQVETRKSHGAFPMLVVPTGTSALLRRFKKDMSYATD